MKDLLCKTRAELVYQQKLISALHALISQLIFNENVLIPAPHIHLLCAAAFSRSPPISGFLDDYAFIIGGLLDLYEATLDTEWLRWAEELQLRQDEMFWDGQGGGYFCSDPSDSTVLLQLKEGWAYEPP